MAKYSVSDAARRAKIARSTMYERYINTGKITVEKANTNGIMKTVIDSAEWERVFGGIVADVGVRTNLADSYSDIKTVTSDTKVLLLLEKLAAADRQIRSLQDDKAWLTSQVDKLTDTIKQIEYKLPAADVMEDPERPGVKRSWLSRLFS